MRQRLQPPRTRFPTRSASHRQRQALARLLVSVAVASTAIFAQEPIFAAPTAAEIKEARALFQAGLALEAAGDYKNALTKFHEVAA
ncbi:MAG TPA: hypothetical protein PK710_20835, partial [Polyangiaceae bacterium]|nr:hypothetical protein [Polyangiaceae bacterium]